MKISNSTEEENVLYWEVFFQGLEQPCEQMFHEFVNIVVNPKNRKEVNNEELQ